ncbi:hypothetical protein BJ508DRAFT_409961 [Ascobolus immersus RN42]|uniref:Uncharacterized protein n=1 Tax=Ascobolus immersus RN42 TaxID=1160509 RepID=A0A3N4IUV7_ASCIM|nr:hypothetical protein BJ508DRAFT_409961 [Ascobolus immersus RN42]
MPDSGMHGAGNSNVGMKNIYEDGDQRRGKQNTPGDSLKAAKELAETSNDPVERAGALNTVHHLEAQMNSKPAGNKHEEQLQNTGAQIDRDLEEEDKRMIDKKNAEGKGPAGATGHGERVKY